MDMVSLVTTSLCLDAVIFHLHGTNQETVETYDFENKSGALLKRYSFIGRVNG